jgi:hypothetical protein
VKFARELTEDTPSKELRTNDMLLSTTTTAQPREQFKVQSATTAAAEEDRRMQCRHELSNSQSTNDRQPAAAEVAEHSTQWLMMRDAAAEDTDPAVGDAGAAVERCRFCRRQPGASTRTAGDVGAMTLMNVLGQLSR